MTAFAGMGAAYGTAKSGIGIAGVGTFRPDLIMKVRRSRVAICVEKKRGRAHADWFPFRIASA